MKVVVASFVVGFIFALGLGFAGMTQPQKVIGFLDIFGAWNPSLLFVMGGALLIHAPLYWMIRQRSTPLLTREWHVPAPGLVTPQLLLGAALFGIGWGLAGYCPAPSLVALASLGWKPIVFVLSMITGMFAHRLVARS